MAGGTHWQLIKPAVELLSYLAGAAGQGGPVRNVRDPRGCSLRSSTAAEMQTVSLLA